MKIKYTDSKDTYGTQTYDNGDQYTGQFLKGKKHGHGILTTLSNRSYDGEWENDVPHGFGTNTFPNGKIYKGEFKNGKPVGEGQWTYQDGSTYTGTWIKGEFVNEKNQRKNLEVGIYIVQKCLKLWLYDQGEEWNRFPPTSGHPASRPSQNSKIGLVHAT